MMSIVVRTVNGEKDESKKLLAYLKREFGLPYALIERLIRTGRVRLDGKRVTGKEVLKFGQVVCLPLVSGWNSEHRKKISFKPSHDDVEKMKKAVIYEDESILAVNKLPGLAVHGGTGVLRSVNRLVQESFEGRFSFLVHRLDKGASGIVLFAKTRGIAQVLADSFKKRVMDKTYLAFVVGKVNPSSGRIISNRVGSSSQVTIDELYREHNNFSAVTYYEVLVYKNGMSLVKFKTGTGRKHQIRIHCAHGLHTPILGDTRYGRRRYHPIKCSFLCLHASSLVFNIGCKHYALKAPLPKHMDMIAMNEGFSEFLV